MEFKLKHLATIRLFSDDVSRSKDWYVSFLGIDPIEDLENFVSFKIQNCCLDICKADKQSPKSTGGSVGYWLVDHLDALMKRATQLGATIYRGPLHVDETQRTIVQIMDPLGNVIGFESTAPYLLSKELQP